MTDTQTDRFEKVRERIQKIELSYECSCEGCRENFINKIIDTEIRPQVEKIAELEKYNNEMREMIIITLSKIERLKTSLGI